jgi:hypothetical protein
MTSATTMERAADVGDAVGLDPTGIQRLTAESQKRLVTKRAVREAVVHELDVLRKRRYRAVELLEELVRQIDSLNAWMERQKEGQEK